MSELYNQVPLTIAYIRIYNFCFVSAVYYRGRKKTESLQNKVGKIYMRVNQKERHTFFSVCMTNTF